MKKISLILCILLVLLTGCSKNNVPKIENHSWLMSTVQRADAEGQVIAYSTNDNSTMESAVHLELECTAKDGIITIVDKSNSKTYTGRYKLENADSQSTIYKIMIEETEGMAVVSITTYNDGSQKPTFIISLGGYTLNFFENID